MYGPCASCTDHKSTAKKRGSVTYRKNRKNEVSKIFTLSGVNKARGKGKNSNVTGLRVEYEPQNLPIAALILTER